MNRKHLLFLVLAATLSPFLVLAQLPSSRFNFKEGAWFELEVNTASQVQGNSEINQYWVRYTFVKQQNGGKQEFTITIHRFKLKMAEREFAENGKAEGKVNTLWYGYDSFYPPYGKSRDSINQVYSFTVNPQGKVTWPQAIKSGGTVQLTQISPRKDLSRFSFYPVDPVPPAFLRQMTVLVVKEIPGIIATRSAGIIRVPGISLLLGNASFPVPPNSWVSGRLNNYQSGPHPDSIKINGKKFRIRPDGSFNVPLFTSSIPSGNISYRNQGFSTFFRPGDTLRITANAADFTGTLQLKGCAAQNTLMANRVTGLFDDFQEKIETYGKETPNTALLQLIQQMINKKENSTIESYRGKASADCITYFRTEWMYLLAEMKLFTLYRTSYKYGNTSKLPFQGFPADYFVDIDTLPLLMNDAAAPYHYEEYLSWFIPFQQARMGISGIGTMGIGFLETYPIALASLKGQPLYYVLQDELLTALSNNSWAENQRLKPYYEEFIASCRDSSYTAPLKKQWATNETWTPGRESPIQQLLLQDGSLPLSKFKGRPFCLIINFNNGSVMKAYYRLLSNPDYKKVQFLIAQPDLPYTSGDPDKKITGLPNVKYVKLKGDAGYLMDTLGISRFDTRMFVTDAWQRIIDGPLLLNDYQPETPVIKVALQSAIRAERFATEDKAYFFKIGIIAVSIVVLAALVSILLNRITARRLQEREAVKRQIKELEIKAIRSQMNPHFIFNALNSIQSLVNSGDIRQANIYLSKFSVLLRNVLANSEKGMVALAEELEAVRLYCELERLRFDFKFDLAVDPLVDLMTEIPGMIIQPLAENAIVHGLAVKREQGSLHIHVTLHNRKLIVTVADNGNGLPVAEQDQLSGKGFGLKLVKERMKMMSHGHRIASLEFRAAAPGAEDQGTTAILTFPLD